MSQADAEKWDSRYQQKTEPNPPAQVLVENQCLLSNTGAALELACGLGGNSLFLAKRGYAVTALDISAVALKHLNRHSQSEGVSITTQVTDLDHWHADGQTFDVVIVSAFYAPMLFGELKQAVAPGGLIFYQTFTQEKVTEAGPSNPNFLLEKGELLKQFSDFELLSYRENSDAGDPLSGLRNQAYIVARNVS